MKGDFTRFTFDPTKRYTQVLKQQGRVDLDADWNEQSAIEDYLERTARMDLAGVECGVPSLKPGFAISLASGGGDLNVSAGRFYAHGLICELFDPTTYTKQPFLPSPPALTPENGQTDLVYLDVWERHLTVIEDPTFREVALGGPDTTTRVQTIFQIRIARIVGTVDCPKAPLPQPSGACLTTSIVPVPPEDDLCLIGPSGGFKGLENRLYRVEIHDPGDLGGATFKWSRDNGSIVFSIQEFVTGQPDKIRVSRLGRDQVLGLHEGDFVEVLDDTNELANTAGTIAQIKSIDHANRELTLSVPVTGSMSAHPKVRRWDQKSVPIKTAAGPIVLEDGIQVSFAGAKFKTGDYWMFAARASDGTIEILTAALPQGIKHTYCRLALVTWTGSATATIHDCRTTFPKGATDCCCCTVTVGDGSKSHGDFTDIQQAIDSLPLTNEFAVVCVLPGTYTLAAPVNIKRNKLLIRGCGANARILAPSTGMAFFVDSATDVTLASLFVVSAQSLAVVAKNASELAIADCLLDVRKGGFSVAVQANVATLQGNVCRGGILIMDSSSRVRIVDNRLENGLSPGVALGGTFDLAFSLDVRGQGVAEIEVRDNVIRGNAGSGVCTIFEFFPSKPELSEVRGLTIAGNLIERNAGSRGVIGDHGAAVVAAGGIVLQHARNVRIFQNRILRNGGEARPACGVFLQQCAHVDVEDNAILDNGNAQGVIARECIDFRVMPVGPGPNPRPESGVKFTLISNDGALLGQSMIMKLGDFTGLQNAARIEIDLPAADSVELGLFLPILPFLPVPNVLQLTAFAGGTQVATLPVGPSATEQRVRLATPGITRLEISGGLYVITEFCRLVTPPVTEFQGGILAHLITTDVRSLNGASFMAGQPAIRVHDNVVKTPAGQSLLITAIGPVSVEGNALTSDGARGQPGPVLSQIRPFGVAIFDFGFTYAPQQNVTSAALLSRLLALAGGDPAGFAKSGIVFDGRVLFQGNQVAFRAFNGTVAIGAWAFGIFSLDACQIANNQFRAETPDIVLGTNVFSVGDTVSAVGNSFAELPNRALFSYVSAGRNAIASLNQAMHCLLVHGTEQEAVLNNQITISTNCPEFVRTSIPFLIRRP